MAELAPFTVLGYFAGVDDQADALLGATAIAQGVYGNGGVVCFSTHPGEHSVCGMQTSLYCTDSSSCVLNVISGPLTVSPCVWIVHFCVSTVNSCVSTVSFCVSTMSSYVSIVSSYVSISSSCISSISSCASTVSS